MERWAEPSDVPWAQNAPEPMSQTMSNFKKKLETNSTYRNDVSSMLKMSNKKRSRKASFINTDKKKPIETNNSNFDL